MKLSEDCYFNKINSKESEEHRKGKLALYTYFKEFFKHKGKDAVVEVDYKLSNGRRTDIYVEVSSKKLAYEYLREDVKLNEWQNKHQDFQSINVVDHWVLSAKDFMVKWKDNKKFFKQFIEKNQIDKIVKLFDTDTNY